VESAVTYILMGSFTSKMAKASQDALAEANSTAEEVIKKLNYNMPQTQRNKALTLAHAQAIHYTSN